MSPACCSPFWAKLMEAGLLIPRALIWRTPCSASAREMMNLPRLKLALQQRTSLRQMGSPLRRVLCAEGEELVSESSSSEEEKSSELEGEIGWLVTRLSLTDESLFAG